jgi:transcriptional regulator with GAF, ATPase, and Fis domain
MTRGWRRVPIIRLGFVTPAGNTATTTWQVLLALLFRLAAAERTQIVAALEKTGWHIRGPAGAAKLLGLKPTTLESRIKKLELQRPR